MPIKRASSKLTDLVSFLETLRFLICLMSYNKGSILQVLSAIS